MCLPEHFLSASILLTDCTAHQMIHIQLLVIAVWIWHNTFRVKSPISSNVMWMGEESISVHLFMCMTKIGLYSDRLYKNWNLKVYQIWSVIKCTLFWYGWKVRLKKLFILGELKHFWFDKVRKDLLMFCPVVFIADKSGL